MSVVLEGEFTVNLFIYLFFGHLYSSRMLIVIPTFISTPHQNQVVHQQLSVPLSAGSLFTFGAGPSSSATIEASISVDTNSTAAPNTFSGGSVTAASVSTAAATIEAAKAVESESCRRA